MYPVNCICYLFNCQVLSLILTSFVRTFLYVKQNVDHRGIRTPNLLIRSQTPDPLGHAVMHPVNCICCLFSCQVLYLVRTRFLRTFLCVKQKVDHREIRTPNLLIRSQTLYPLGHAAMYPVNCICYLFNCQVLSLILTSFVRTFLCVKQNQSRICGKGAGLSLFPSDSLSFESYEQFVRKSKNDCFLAILG